MYVVVCYDVVSDRRQAAAREQQRATPPADDVATLAAWLRHDVLAVAGPGVRQRRELYDFLVDELRQREEQCAHRLRPVRVLPADHAEELLRFAEEVDFDVRSLAAAAKVPEAVVRALVAVQEMASTGGTLRRRDQALRTLLGARRRALSGQVEELRQGVVRASSLVENLNSRLRNYFHRRREVGGGYLELPRFFLNHRRFLRSERPARAGRSPAELLSARGHAHWLELLGYARYQRAAWGRGGKPVPGAWVLASSKMRDGPPCAPAGFPHSCNPKGPCSEPGRSLPHRHWWYNGLE